MSEVQCWQVFGPFARQRSSNTIRRIDKRREFLEKMPNMKKFLTGLVVVGLGFASTCLTAGAASSKTDLDARLDAATRVINEVMATPDKAIPNQITEKATCIGVVPSMKKAAFLVGGQYGQGAVTCRTPHG